MYLCAAGLANYCVPAGEAYDKALELAREITKKVRTFQF
jgi:methylglutaconyl-CoA hydratase